MLGGFNGTSFPRELTQDRIGGIEPSVAGVSWAAVLAGAVASLALTLVLLAFGAGMGFTVVSPWGNSGVSATTFKIGTGPLLYCDGDDFIRHRRLFGRPPPDEMGGGADYRSALPRYRTWLFGVGSRLRYSARFCSLLRQVRWSGGTLSPELRRAAANSQRNPRRWSGYVDTLLRSNDPSALKVNKTLPTRRGEMVRLFTTSFHNGSDFNPADRSICCQGRRRPVPA